MSRVLVTGGEGFIGSHLVDLLVKEGYTVRSTCLYNSFGEQGWLADLDKAVREEVEVRPMDIRDPDATSRVVQGCTAVFHLAALIGIPYSYGAPHSYVDVNVSGTLNVLQASLSAGVEQLIHTSTSEVYGTAKSTPMTEEHPLNAQSPYAATKIAADQLALSFFRSFELPVKVVRPFNAYGPRQSERAVIPTIMAQALSPKRTIRLGSLEPRRDFTYVSDTARGFLAALASEDAIGEVVNLGSGSDISVGELAEQILDVLGLEAVVESGEDERLRPAQSDVMLLQASTDKAKRLLRWTPEYSGLQGLRRGLSETAEWFKFTYRKNANSGAFVV